MIEILATEVEKLEEELELLIGSAMVIDVLQSISIILIPILLIIILIAIIKTNKDKKETLEIIEKKLYKIELQLNAIQSHTGKTESTLSKLINTINDDK